MLKKYKKRNKLSFLLILLVASLAIPLFQDSIFSSLHREIYVENLEELIDIRSSAFWDLSGSPIFFK